MRRETTLCDRVPAPVKEKFLFFTLPLAFTRRGNGVFICLFYDQRNCFGPVLADCIEIKCKVYNRFSTASDFIFSCLLASSSDLRFFLG